MEPCGTPNLIVSQHEFVPLMLTNWSRDLLSHTYLIFSVRWRDSHYQTPLPNQGIQCTLIDDYPYYVEVFRKYRQWLIPYYIFCENRIDSQIAICFYQENLKAQLRLVFLIVSPYQVEVILAYKNSNPAYPPLYITE